MKQSYPTRVFVTSHAISAAYGLLHNIATPGQDVRASGTHGMDAVCTAVACIDKDVRRPLAALIACDRNKNSGWVACFFYTANSHSKSIPLKKQYSLPQTGIYLKVFETIIYCFCKFLFAVESISLIRFNWFTSLAPGS